MGCIVLLGPPGAGKGTQAVELARRLSVPHLSTGELLRAAMRRKTALGDEAERYVRAGKLVPDELVLRLLQSRIARPDCREGYVLDGYPRNLAQAETLDRITKVDRVLFFVIPESLLVERLTARRSCPRCGTAYNLVSKPPKRAGTCDLDGEPLIRRSDDDEDPVRTRLGIYRTETIPLVEFYRNRNLLQEVDATGSPDDVARRIGRALETGAGFSRVGRQR